MQLLLHLLCSRYLSLCNCIFSLNCVYMGNYFSMSVDKRKSSQLPYPATIEKDLHCVLKHLYLQSIL